MVNREVTGAHYGLRDWLAQRLTAIVMLLYTFLAIGLLIATPTLDYDAWREMFMPQWMKLATLLFLLSVFLHAWVGMRNIFMDYVKHGGLRLALHALVIVALIAYAAWSAQILWSI